MDASSVILIMGYVMFALGVKFLIQPKVMSGIINEVTASETLSLLLGLLPLLLGSIVVFAYGAGLSDDKLQSLLVILGYLMVAVGLFRLWATPLWHTVLHSVAGTNKENVAVGMVLILSIVLMFIGHGVVVLA